MALFDSDQQKIILRIVYDGAERAGKTTNVTQLCGFFSTLRRSDVFTPEVRDGRTIYFDWMQLEAGLIAGYRIRCQLLTVPGQSGLSRRRWQLLKTADAVVFVCESTPEGIEVARPMFNLVRDYLQSLKQQVEVPLVLQANKQDVPGALDPHAVASALGFERGGLLVGARASEGVGVRDTVVLAIRSAANVAERMVLDRGVDALAGTEETGEALYAWMRGEEAHIIESPEVEREARADAERKAREAADRAEGERHARAEAERAEAERAEAERRSREAAARAEAQAREAAARAEAQAREAAARAEAERQAREAAERAEAERQAREAAQRAEAERQAREAAERAEAERQAREAAARAEAERQAREAAARAEAERQAREAAERAEAERQAREAAERAEAERQAREAAERAEAEAREAYARAEAERQAREAAERAEAEAREAYARAEAERQAREAAERAEAEAREARARAEAERQAREAADQAARRRAIEAAERAETEARAAEARAEAERQVEEAAARAEMEAREAMARADAERRFREGERMARETAARAEAERHAREAAVRAERERAEAARAEAERADAERRARDIAERQAARAEAERAAQAAQARPATQRVGLNDLAREVARAAGERQGTIIGVPDPSGVPFKTRFQAAEAAERERAEAARAARDAAERAEAERRKARDVMRSRFDGSDRFSEVDRRAREIAERQGAARLAAEPMSRAPGSEAASRPLDSMSPGGAERQAKMSAERAEVERMAREAAERRDADRRAREAQDRVEAERRTREAAEKAATERQAREAAEQAALERTSREAAARADAQRRAREAAERAATGGIVGGGAGGGGGGGGGSELVPRGSAPFFVSTGGPRDAVQPEPPSRRAGAPITMGSQPPPSSVAAGSMFVLLASGIEPPMPRADVGIGFIWPSATGRDILRRVMAAGPIVRRDDVVIQRMKLGSGLTDEIIYQAGSYSLKTSLSRRFSDLDEGRTELLKLARKKMQTGRLVPETAVLSIQPEEGGGAWLWSVMPWLPTLQMAMEEAALQRDEARLTEALVSYAEGAAEALIVAARQRLILNVHPDNFARSRNDLYYVDDNIAQGSRIPDLGHAILQRCVDYASFPSAVNSFITMFATYVGRSINRKLMDELGVDEAFAEEALISPLARPAQEKLFRLLGR